MKRPTQFSEEPIDVEALREKYIAERERRIRPNGAKQYTRTTGEFSYYARDPYTEFVDRAPVTDDVEVLIVGSGIGGLCAGARLRQVGIESIRLIDDAGDVGGTWYWNRYPGIRCDVESYVYIPMLEMIGHIPTERYATGEEIRQCLVSVAKHFELYRDFLGHTKATSFTWDDAAQRWIVTTDREDRFTARYVIVGAGLFTDPKLPGIPGIENFTGHTFHTARWDYGYTGGDQSGGLSGLADKRVAIVGTGATAVQVVPMVAQHAKEALVFQRTPSSVGVRGNGPTDPEWVRQLKPGWQDERAWNFTAVMAGEPAIGSEVVADGWAHNTLPLRLRLTGPFTEADPALTPDELDAWLEIEDFRTMNWMRARIEEIVQDKATADALKPWYRYGCKRPTFSDEYLAAFNVPGVRLIDTGETGGITRMTHDGVVVGDQEYQVDVVIFATGFDPGASGLASGQLPTVGRDGKTLLESWDRGPRTLHGAMVDGFPNLFAMGQTQTAYSINLSHMLQLQAIHIAEIIDRAQQTGAKRVEPTPEAVEAFQELMVENWRDIRKYNDECTPSYYNREGESAPLPGNTFSPGPVAFHRMLAEWRMGDMHDVLVPRDAEA